MSRQKERRSGAQQDDSRLNILKAAFELFARKGYARTSVDSVARKAGVSKGLIYHYFESKDALLKGVFLMMKGEADQLFENMDALPPDEFLDRMVTLSLQYLVRRTQHFRLLLALSLQLDVVKGLKQEIEDMRNEWFHSLTQLFAALGYEQPRAEACLFSAMLDGIGIGYSLVPADYPMEEIRELIMVRYGIA